MQPNENSWVREFPGAITVCDPCGIILEMNDQSARLFAGDGGRDLIGTNVLDCHPEPARSKLEAMMKEHRVNVYTTEKNGVKRLIYQAPWFVNGEYRGFIEVGLEVPSIIPHFVRV
jgi:hypothetical protein